MTLVETWLLPPVGPSLANPKSESFASLIAMKKRKPLCSPKSNFEAEAPRKRLEIRTPCEDIPNTCHSYSIILQPDNIHRLRNGLTSKEMILQASPRHKLVHQKPIIVLQTVANEFHQIRMGELPQIVHFCLQSRTKDINTYIHTKSQLN
ncbi:5'-3' exonuclease family protein [Striga asiatica]|uniref:5'-3' exonuclease family protein n=1 Tax=Striga asiatica TaxID=4170 RepID=A0A5A7R462_STRAF|nr:5'-3' exonuclease family protein [Striga asiatica]